MEQLDLQLLAVLAEDHPQSVRHLFYRMTDPRLAEPVEKSERGYRHVQDRLVKLRRIGRVSYGCITDATRRGYHVATFDGPADFLRSMAGSYRANLWEQADAYVEVWTESRSIAGVIEDTCRELAVSLYPAGGFSSITLAYQAAEHINVFAKNKDEALVLYIGDHDPAGVLIDVAIEREMREHLDPDIEFTFQRIAITPEQIEQFNLPTKPRKTGDRRARHVEATVEAEAMPAHILRRILRLYIEAELPPDALSTVKAAEQSERQHLLRMAEMMGGAS